MWLTKTAIERPITCIVVFLTILVLGLRSVGGMLVELNPKVDIPFVGVSTVYLGAGPEEIETLVTDPIEAAVSSVNLVKNVSSVSRDGVSIVSIEFELKADLNIALSDVRAKVDEVVQKLPRDAEKPVVSKFDISAMPIMLIGVSSSLPTRETKHVAEKQIRDAFQRVPGVASVSVVGGEDREIRVALEKGRLDAYGLTASEVARALGSQNLNLPGGTIKELSHEYAIRVVGEFESVDQIRNSRLHFPGKGPRPEKSLTLSEIAAVSDTVAEPSEISRVNGRESVTLTIQKNADANTVDVADGVKKAGGVLKEQLAGGFGFTYASDQSKNVLDNLLEVRSHLIIDILLVVLVVFFFLHSFRGTLIVSLAIPTCLLAVFIPMYFLGFTLNQMTMLGLALVIGILVDDAIVVLENIHRHLQDGENPKEAAFNGRTEIGLAAVAITLTDVVVFVPVAFMGGIVGRFFREFGLTVAMATLLSLFVSFTLTPMLASRFYRRGEHMDRKGRIFRGIEGFYSGLDEGYRKLLHWALRFRWLVIFAGFLSLVAIMLVFGPRLGFQFMPAMDTGQVAAVVETPAGTSLQRTNEIVQRVEKIVSTFPEVENVVGTTGRVSGGARGFGEQGANYGMVDITLIEKERLLDRVLKPIGRRSHSKLRTLSDQDLAGKVRKQVADIAGADIKVFTVRGWMGASAPIQIELRGPVIDELNTVASQIIKSLRTVPGVFAPDISWRVGKPEVKIEIDRLKASELGLSVAEIAQAVRDSIEGNTSYKYREGGDEYDLRIQLARLDRDDVSDVETILVDTSETGPVYLRDVARVYMGAGPTKIERKNREREVVVSAQLVPGYPSGNAQLDINKAIADIPLGQVRLHWGGEVEAQMENGKYMFGALGLSVILVYLLMAALFESFLNPFIIMFTLPMALIGGILALVLTHTTLSIIAFIGVIMLMGLVTKNAILLIDYTNTLRERGLERDEAIETAGPTRLRPILMTTLSILFGLLPLSMKLGPGSEQRAPLAITVQGGLIVSTVLTLVVIPCLYSVADDFTNWIRRLFHRGQRKGGVH
ncbi:MAG: efflux RND transporter permease subunit [Armatimonadetes bacterium]|nr:efflux RND transporter permease subunit [Armatimonadota bacterium]